MTEVDRSIPVLPAKSMEATLAFYRRLGFDAEVVSTPPAPDYAIADRGTLEIHFFLHEDLLPQQSAFGCYFRVNDVDALYREYAALGLPKTGMPRIIELEDKPWGMREFALIDENGSLIRIGQEL
ncbi:bleomycin resistance protein [Roseateles sp. BYS180W]|uniref:Bleomycin resistance protein n=1 Tax=Roseateles rivi TaxID=3299028 RepID=A0ABW7FTR1_9BURK